MDLNGTTTYYTPAGIRYVKQILLKFREEDRAAIDAAETKITEAENRKAAAQQILEEAAAAEEDLDAARDELAAAEAELEAARTERKDALETAFATLDEEADAILDALAENPDSWDRLMEEKNEDPGLMAGAIHAEKGYAVCEGMTSFDAAFVNAAMALEQVGSVSGKVRGESYGYYIIRYVSDAPEGPADYDAVKEILRSSLLASGQSDAYSAAIAQWVAEAGIEENLEALDN